MALARPDHLANALAVPVLAAFSDHAATWLTVTATRNLHAGPCVVVIVGTATTIDALEDRARYSQAGQPTRGSKLGAIRATRPPRAAARKGVIHCGAVSPAPTSGRISVARYKDHLRHVVYLYAHSIILSWLAAWGRQGNLESQTSRVHPLNS